MFFLLSPECHRLKISFQFAQKLAIFCITDCDSWALNGAWYWHHIVSVMSHCALTEKCYYNR